MTSQGQVSIGLCSHGLCMDVRTLCTPDLTLESSPSTLHPYVQRIDLMKTYNGVARFIFAGWFSFTLRAPGGGPAT